MDSIEEVANIKRRKFILIFRIIYLITVLMQIFACYFSGKEYPSYLSLILSLIYFPLPLILLLFNMNYKTKSYTYKNIITISIIIILVLSAVFVLDKTALGILGFYYIFFVILVLIITGKNALSGKTN
jgi:hypothetical protein